MTHALLGITGSRLLNSDAMTDIERIVTLALDRDRRIITRGTKGADLYAIQMLERTSIESCKESIVVYPFCDIWRVPEEWISSYRPAQHWFAMFESDGGTIDYGPLNESSTTQELKNELKRDNEKLIHYLVQHDGILVVCTQKEEPNILHLIQTAGKENVRIYTPTTLFLGFEVSPPLVSYWTPPDIE